MAKKTSTIGVFNKNGVFVSSFSTFLKERDIYNKYRKYHIAFWRANLKDEVYTFQYENETYFLKYI